MSGSTRLTRWLVVRCPLPHGRRRADAFITGILGPWMNGLMDAGDVTDWFFERGGDGALTIHVGGDSPTLRARFRGLALAITHIGTLAVDAGRSPGAATSGTAGHEDRKPHAVRFRGGLTQLALAVIAATPTRSARLRAALALSLAAADTCLADPVRAGAGTRDGRSYPTLRSADALWAQAVRVSPVGVPESPLPLISELVTAAGPGTAGAERGSAGAGFCAAIRVDDPLGGAVAGALRHLHNQLGLTAVDESLVYASLTRMLPAASGSSAAARTSSVAARSRPASRYLRAGGHPNHR